MHPAEQYIHEVTSGKRPACYMVRAAYQRHLNDLKRCKEKGWVFDPNIPHKLIQIFKLFRHYKGAYAGQPLQLEPWQQAILWVVYGWQKRMPDGSLRRRFRQVYLEIPKKNGKTTMLAGIGIIHFAFDRESGAEVYTAATKRDQAKICFNDIKAFIKHSPFLSKEFGVHQSTVFNHRTDSKIAPLSKETNTEDGFNPSAAIVDELHRHPDSEMVDLLSQSMSTRRQPMIWEITTAGTDKQSICYKHREYTHQVNTGKFTDDQWWGLIYTLDDDDDWRDPVAWEKANPNLGTGKDKEALADMVNKATNDPTRENSVKRYQFNLWTGSEEKWISEKIWDEGNCQRSEDELTDSNVAVYGGLDLASTSDFNALTLTFIKTEPGAGTQWMHQKYWFWIPDDVLQQRVAKQVMDFNQWVEAGHIRTFPGNVIDTNLLKEELYQILNHYQVRGLAYDKYLATHGSIQHLVEQGINCTPQAQGIMHMSYPTKELERLLLKGDLTHDDNPCMAWQMGNVLIYRDANDNKKIHKSKSSEKVDGPVSAVMSLAELLDSDTAPKESPYNEVDLF